MILTLTFMVLGLILIISGGALLTTRKHRRLGIVCVALGIGLMVFPILTTSFGFSDAG